MFSSLRLVSLASGSREEAAKQLAETSSAVRAASTLCAPTCPGVWNGGDLIWRSEYRDEAAWRAAESSDAFRRGAGALLADSRARSRRRARRVSGRSAGRRIASERRPLPRGPVLREPEADARASRPLRARDGGDAAPRALDPPLAARHAASRERRASLDPRLGAGVRRSRGPDAPVHAPSLSLVERRPLVRSRGSRLARRPAPLSHVLRDPRAGDRRW